MTPTSDVKCANWRAWTDMQPPGPEFLHVEGECTFPTSGYRVELKPASPQGINPKIYILDKIVHRPTGPVNDVATTLVVLYREGTTATYTDVQIRPDDVLVPVKTTR